jgi:hypothetical protein
MGPKYREIQTPFSRRLAGSQRRVQDRFARAAGVVEGRSGGLTGNSVGNSGHTDLPTRLVSRFLHDQHKKSDEHCRHRLTDINRSPRQAVRMATARATIIPPGSSGYYPCVSSVRVLAFSAMPSGVR